MRNFIKKYFPAEAIVPLVAILIFQCFCYLVPKFFIAQGWYIKMLDLTTQFDRDTPFIPEFIFIYFGCYVFWALGIFVLYRTKDKKRCYDMVLSVLICHVICFFIYVLFPTTTLIRPDLSNYSGSNISMLICKLCFSSDTPYNLLPSMHCTVSWFCYMAIRNRKEISFGYRLFSLLFCFAIFASILFTKQHYVWDIVPSIVLCEVVYFIVKKTSISNKLKNICTKLNKTLKIDKLIQE